MAKQLTSRDTLLLAVGAVPTASEVITTANRILVNPKAPTVEYNDFGNGKAGNTKAITNDDDVTAEFSVEVVARTSGAAGVVPKYADLLKCCGLKETVNADTDVIYTPEMLEQPATAIAYLDGSKRDITGISGDFSFGGGIGQLAKFTFSLKGFTSLAPVVEANPAVTLDTNELLHIESATAITVGGGTIDLKSFEFSLGNDTKKVYGTESKEYYNADFKPTIKVSAVKLKDNETHWDEFRTNSKKSIVITFGTEAGNIIEFRADLCNPIEVSESDSDGQVNYERTWLCENSAGGDNFSLTFK